VGEDFPEEHFDFLKKRNIGLSGVLKEKGETFRWSGYYEYDMNNAHTKDTKLNVLSGFSPKVDDKHLECEYVFLANLDPEKQIEIIEKSKNKRFIAADTMDYWIKNKRDALYEVIKKVDYVLINESEIRMFMETPNLPLAAKRLIKLGAKGVIIKKGEHGALLFTQDSHFSAPSYPQDIFRDPTGAGDSFAGGFLGYLSKTKDTSLINVRKGIILGSVMASFNIEDFSLDRMKSLTLKEIMERYNEFKRFSEFDVLSFSAI